MPPTNFRLTRADEIAVAVAWDTLTLEWQTGGSPVTAYELEWDAGSPSSFAALTLSPSALATAHSEPVPAAGVRYSFRVRARNLFGAGPLSALVSGLAVNLPGAVPNVVVAYNPPSQPEQVTLTWDPAPDRGQHLQAYRVRLLAANGTFLERTDLCDGAAAGMLSSRLCLFAFPDLTADPLALRYPAALSVEVSARNALGWGPGTVAVGPSVLTPPTAAPTLVAGSEAHDALVFSWSNLALADSGGELPSSLALFWDRGNASAPLPLTANRLETFAPATTSYTAIPPVVEAGRSYRFQLRADSRLGPGQVLSPALSMKAHSPPGVPGAPQPAQTDANLTLEWSAAPAHGEQVDLYELNVLSAAGAWTNLTACDAALETRCSLPLLTLAEAPFSLALGASLVFRARARNSLGWGPAYSANGTAGFTMQALPTAAPTLSEGSHTTGSQLSLLWTVPSDNLSTGGSPFTLYELGISSTGATGTFANSKTVTAPLLSVNLTAGVTQGTLFHVRIRARTALGWGPYIATPLPVLASEPPPAPARSTITLALQADPSTQFRVAWGVPDNDGGSPITRYAVLLLDSAGALHNVTSSCADQAAIFANRQCDLEMSLLWAAPFSFAQNTQV